MASWFHNRGPELEQTLVPERAIEVCPECDGILQPIKVIDATQGSGWEQEGGGHVELSFAAPDAKPSFFLGKIPRMGIVKGMICPKCGRILFYGEKTDGGSIK